MNRPSKIVVGVALGNLLFDGCNTKETEKEQSSCFLPNSSDLKEAKSPESLAGLYLLDGEGHDFSALQGGTEPEVCTCQCTRHGIHSGYYRRLCLQ